MSTQTVILIFALILVILSTVLTIYGSVKIDKGHKGTDVNKYLIGSAISGSFAAITIIGAFFL